MASVKDLPNEMLEEILLYLPPDDRVHCAVVCPRWHHLLSKSHMLKDVRLHLAEAEIRTAMEVLQNSEMKYTSLEIRCGCRASDRLLPFPKGLSMQSIRESLRGVRHLSLERNHLISDASFHCLLELMPHLTSLCVVEPSLKFHDVRVYNSSSVFSFRNVLACMMKCKSRFTSLDFSLTPINAEAIAQIVGVYGDHLTELRLDSCHHQLTDDASVSIAKCRNLRRLSMSYTRIDDAHLEAILRETVNLEHLDLSNCHRIRDSGCLAISKLKRLQNLSLDKCGAISRGAFASLGRVRTLRHLSLTEVEFGVDVLQVLLALVELRVFRMECNCCDDKCLQMVCDHLKKLDTLCFNSVMSTVTDVGASELRKLTGLRKLSLSGITNITDRSLENGLGSVDMRSFYLRDATHLTDSALVSFASHHRSLEIFSLSGCTQITDEGVISLIQSATRLRTLTLWDCPALTDRSLTVLQSHCPRLRELIIRQRNISADAIDLFQRKRPTVVVLKW